MERIADLRRLKTEQIAAIKAAANRLGVPVTGSLGVLILAKREGRLSAVAPAVRAMKAAGIFLPSDKSLQMLLVTLGETWL